MNIINRLHSNSSDEYDPIDEYTKNYTELYQLQYIKDDVYKFVSIGFFLNHSKLLELTKFEINKIYIYNCEVYSNFLDNTKCNTYDILTIFINTNNIHLNKFKIILSIEINEPDFKTENKGLISLFLIYSDNKIKIKTDLVHNENIHYLLIEELIKIIDFIDILDFKSINLKTEFEKLK
jgi:hypothetical protein